MKKMMIVLVLVSLVLAVLACGGSASSSSASTPSSLAFTACTVFVERQLGISPSQAQRYAASQVSQSGSTFTVNVYYASLGQTYRCELSRHANGDTELLSLSAR